MPKNRRWTSQQLKNAVKNSTSYRQVLLKLKLREAGGNYTQIKKYIAEFNLDTAHFTGHGWRKGRKFKYKPKRSLESILQKGTEYQSYKLKRRLFAANLKPQYCEICRWAEKTSDGYLPLELDHINGDRHDNRIENLRILCPNCHSLQPTHRGRKLKKK